MPDRTPQKKFNTSETPKLKETEASGAAQLPDLHILPAETLIDEKYKILSCIDSSMLAVIYRADHIIKKKEYSLKVFAAEFSDSQIERFLSDCRAVSLIDHPNTATLADFGVHENTQPYCVTELVEGVTLADYLDRCGRLIYDDIFSVFLPLCWALQDAHEKGIIHRNVKPSNIMLIGEQGNWQCKLLDFANGKLSEGGRKPRDFHTRATANTLYLSPEQCSGKKLDYRTDIYSLGCTLFEAITAHPVFSGSTPEETKQMHLKEQPPSLREGSLGREFPEDLEGIIQTMLAKNPQHRYTSASQVAENLMRLKLSTQLRIKVKPKDSPSKLSQENTIVILCLTTAVALGLAFYFWLQLGQPIQEFGHAGRPIVAALNSEAPLLPSSSHSQREPNLSQVRDYSEKKFCERSSTIDGKEFRFYKFPDRAIGTLKDPKGYTVKACGALNLEFSGPWKFKILPTSFVHHPKILKRFRDDEIRSLEIAAIRDLNQDELLELKNYKYLDELIVESSDFNNSGLKYVELIPTLSTLSLKSTEVNSFGLQRFANLRNLKTLEVRDMSGIGRVLRKLSASTKLENLSLHMCNDMTQADYAAIAAIPNLKRLAFSKEPEIDPALFEALSESKSLRELDIRNGALSEAALKSLAKLKNLHTLSLSVESRSQSQQLNSLLPACKINYID